jgi:hypothetical protein
MKKLMSFLIFIILFSNCLWADAPKAFINSESKLSVNGKIYTQSFLTGSFGGENIFSEQPMAQHHYDKHQSYSTYGAICLWGGVAGAVAYAITADELKAGPYFGIFAAGLLPAIFLQVSARKHFWKALNIYNGVSPELADTNTFDWTPTILLGSDDHVAPGVAFQINF